MIVSAAGWEGYGGLPAGLTGRLQDSVRSGQAMKRGHAHELSGGGAENCPGLDFSFSLDSFSLGQNES